MGFWDNVWSQFLGDLLAGSILLTVGLILEAVLDEKLAKRHERKNGRQ